MRSTPLLGPAQLGVALVLLFASSIAAQSTESTGPVHLGYDPAAPRDGHFHVGEIGERLFSAEERIKCNCGCGFDVHTCQFQMQCGVSPSWTQRIMQSLEAGQSVEAIEAGFVADYGLTVLMAPPPEGFNLVGYFLPALAIVSVGLLLGLLVRGGPSRERVASGTEVSAADEERLRDALRKLDEAEGPDW